MIFTAHSTVGEIMQTEKGRMVMAGMQKHNQDSSHMSSEHLGEGSDEMVKAMMVEMPLKKAVSFGQMTEEQFESLIKALNE